MRISPPSNQLTYGVVHGDVPLQRDPHGHEDGGAHADGLRRVEEVREQLSVQLSAEVKAEREKYTFRGSTRVFLSTV